MRTGEVMLWRATWGFIREDESHDRFFVHVNEVTHNDMLHKGQRVRFEVEVSPKSGRLQAVNVVPL
jgi:cold shock CspA family protein